MHPDDEDSHLNMRAGTCYVASLDLSQTIDSAEIGHLRSNQ